MGQDAENDGAPASGSRPAMDAGGAYVAFCLFAWSLILLGIGFGAGFWAAG